MSQPVTVELPYFVSRVLPVLPKFLEAVDLRIDDVRKISFKPDHIGEREDPPIGCVFFDGRGWAVNIYVHYRPGEEGTRGSLDDVREINLVRHEQTVGFVYVPHYCGCPQCHGLKYPFRPSNIRESAFRLLSDEECLEQIRLALKPVPQAVAS